MKNNRGTLGCITVPNAVKNAVGREGRRWGYNHREHIVESAPVGVREAERLDLGDLGHQGMRDGRSPLLYVWKFRVDDKEGIYH